MPHPRCQRFAQNEGVPTIMLVKWGAEWHWPLVQNWYGKAAGATQGRRAYGSEENDTADNRLRTQEAYRLSRPAVSRFLGHAGEVAPEKLRCGGFI
jgi:hypothetical protein